MDLNILQEDQCDDLKSKICIAMKLGYDKIAINKYISNLGKYYNFKKQKEKPRSIPVPSSLKLKDAEISCMMKTLGRKKEFTQLSRITVLFNDVNHTRLLQRDEVIRQYDLIAVEPTNEKLLEVACFNLNIDIISFNFSEKLPFSLKKNRRKLHGAIERGIMLEIQYAPMIRDKSLRKYVISNATSLVEVCKAKNIIVTSGCEQAMELRAPFDVQNLSLLFGLNEIQAKNSNTLMCQKCITHGETAGKRLSKCIVSVTKLECDIPKDMDEATCTKDGSDDLSDSKNAINETNDINTNKQNVFDSFTKCDDSVKGMVHSVDLSTDTTVNINLKLKNKSVSDDDNLNPAKKLKLSS